MLSFIEIGSVLRKKYYLKSVWFDYFQSLLLSPLREKHAPSSKKKKSQIP